MKEISKKNRKNQLVNYWLVLRKFWVFLLPICDPVTHVYLQKYFENENWSQMSSSLVFLTSDDVQKRLYSVMAGERIPRFRNSNVVRSLKKITLYCSIMLRKGKSKALWIAIKVIKPYPILLLCWTAGTNFNFLTSFKFLIMLRHKCNMSFFSSEAFTEYVQINVKILL